MKKLFLIFALFALAIGCETPKRKTQAVLPDGRTVEITFEPPEKDRIIVFAYLGESVDENEANGYKIARAVFAEQFHDLGQISPSNVEIIKRTDKYDPFAFGCWRVENSDFKFCQEFLDEPFDGKPKGIFVFHLKSR